MRDVLKVLLIVAGIGVIGLGLVAAGAWYWWDRHGADYVEQATASLLEGRRAGVTLEEKACLDEAFARHRAAEKRPMSFVLKTNLWLSGCLAASARSPEFCSGVPAPDRLLDRAAWAMSVCTKGLTFDQDCQSYMDTVASYYYSDERVYKHDTRQSHARLRKVVGVRFMTDNGVIA